jgi:hypothetical protein
MLPLSQLLAGILLAFCLVGQSLKSYAEPGSGAVLWQFIFASIVSIGFHFRKLRRWIFKRWPKREQRVRHSNVMQFR